MRDDFGKSQYRQLRMGYNYEIGTPFGNQEYLLEKNPLGTSRKLLVA